MNAIKTLVSLEILSETQIVHRGGKLYAAREVVDLISA
jgi:hypothetical protein